MIYKLIVLYSQHTVEKLLSSMLSSLKSVDDYKIEWIDINHHTFEAVVKFNRWDLCITEEKVIQSLNDTEALQLVNLMPTILLASNEDDSSNKSVGFADILTFNKLSTELLERSLLFIHTQKKHQHQLKALTLQDPLTKLPNRNYFQSQLTSKIARSARSRGNFSVLVIDLDRFKHINDSLGHESGDRYLIHISTILNKNLRQNDFAARLGSDEFAIILDTNHADLMAQRLLEAFQESFYLKGREVKVHASIGITSFPQDGTTNSQLMKAANSALMEVKKKGGGALCFFDASKQGSISQPWIVSEFYNALNSGQLYLHYQPQVTAHNRQWVALEALCRWTHPEKGFISPAVFIPAIEHTPMIIDLGRWVLESVCQELAALKTFGKNVRIAVNISMMHICHPDFVSELKQLLDLTGANPKLLELELTESALLMDPEQTNTALSALRELGISVAIDDFGTGHSSLAYLIDLPVDVLKIDRSFVAEFSSNEKKETIIKTIIALAKSLKLTTVAEGIEDKYTAEYLSDLGCDILQGYYFGKPTRLPEMMPLLANGH